MGSRKLSDIWLLQVILIFGHSTSRLWQIFLEDRNQPGRLVLAKEQPSRPTLDDIDVCILFRAFTTAPLLICFFPSYHAFFLPLATMGSFLVNQQ